MAQIIDSNGFGFFNNDGGFTENHRFYSVNTDNNAVYGFQCIKRLKLSSEFNQEREKLNSCGQTSVPVLGLKLKKTPSFLDLLEMELSQARKTSVSTQKTQAKKNDEKLKASNFPALFLRIGSWERISWHEGDLIAKCYYAKKKLVWEILDGALKCKIEMQWSDISAIRATIRDNEPGILEIELNQPPLFYRETDPQPRKHTVWQLASDFTGGQATICRKHYITFPPGALDKHYEKLLQYDQRLSVLSKRPFPSQESTLFPSNNGFNEFTFNLTGYEPEISPRVQYPFNAAASVPLHHIQNFKPNTVLPVGIMKSTSPMSVMDFPYMDKKGINCAFDNQIQGSSSITSVTRVNNVLNYDEEEEVDISSTRILDEIKNHLLSDSEITCSDEKLLLARVESMGSLLEQLEGASPLDLSDTNEFEYEKETINNDLLMSNAIEQTGKNGGILYPKPISRLPPQDSYGFSESTMEDFYIPDSSQETRRWG